MSDENQTVANKRISSFWLKFLGGRGEKEEGERWFVYFLGKNVLLCKNMFFVKVKMVIFFVITISK